MKTCILLFSFFLYFANVSAQNIKLLPSGFTSSGEKILLKDITTNSCTEANKKASMGLRKKINSETKIICISGFADFDPETYKYLFHKNYDRETSFARHPVLKLDISSLQPGIYFVEWKQGMKRRIGKLIVQ